MNIKSNAAGKFLLTFFIVRFFLRAGRKKGQVTVELLLVLPVFLLMIFFIMELGNLAFQTILYHHSAYELARIGSMLAGPPGGSKISASNVPLATSRLKDILSNQMKINCRLLPEPRAENTRSDPQVTATGGTFMNEDLVVSLTCDAKLVFPGSSYILSDNKFARTKRIAVQVRMPIEKPLFQ